MKNEPIISKLRRLLAENTGLHNQIAKETGVSQATVSRIHLGLASPTLDKAQPLLDWFDNQAKKKPSARRAANARVRASSVSVAESAQVGQ